MEPIKTKVEEVWSRVKTLLWGTMWVALSFFVDNAAQLLVGISLPSIETPLGNINTAVVVGLVINQISKYMHNKNQGRVE